MQPIKLYFDNDAVLETDTELEKLRKLGFAFNIDGKNVTLQSIPAGWNIEESFSVAGEKHWVVTEETGASSQQLHLVPVGNDLFMYEYVTTSVTVRLETVPNMVGDETIAAFTRMGFSLLRGPHDPKWSVFTLLLPTGWTVNPLMDKEVKKEVLKDPSRKNRVLLHPLVSEEGSDTLFFPEIIRN